MPRGLRIAVVQRKNALRRKLGNAVPVRFKVVYQGNMGNRKRLDQVARIQSPRQIRQFQTPIANRPWTAKTGRKYIAALS